MKKLKKLLALVIVVAMAFPTTAFAAQESTAEAEVAVRRAQSHSGSYSDNFTHSYRDQYGVSRQISGTATCSAVVAWEEGVSGWIVSATFYTPTITTPGSSIRLTHDGVTKGLGSSTAYQSYLINGGDATLRSNISCDAYGDTSMYVNIYD